MGSEMCIRDSHHTDVDARLKITPEDWVANFMLQNGTWNTPVVFLENTNNVHGIANRKQLKHPFHLLEGHTRLSYFIGLRETGRVNLCHDVWLATIER